LAFGFWLLAFGFWGWAGLVAVGCWVLLKFTTNRPFLYDYSLRAASLLIASLGQLVNAES
jgi:hypothetical protein